MKTNHLVFLIITIVFIGGCKSINLKSLENNIKSVKYGTSFGHCVGVNCNKTYTFSKDEIIYSRRTNGTINDSLAVKIDLETEQWENLVNTINDSDMKKLPERIGCPDCADGGSEWIEISEDDKIMRVTYEYGNTPEEIKAVVKIVKRLIEPFQQEKSK